MNKQIAQTQFNDEYLNGGKTDAFENDDSDLNENGER
jgi:hypothetical protein